MTRALVHGAGRMARRVLALSLGSESIELIGLVSRTQPDDDLGVRWYSGLDEVDVPVDLLIDFTLPGGVGVAAQWCAEKNVALLSGTTGLSKEEFSDLENAALKVPVMWASNLSQGVALVTEMSRQAARALGEQASVSITDIHHQHKKDAPSGTALSLARAIDESRPVATLGKTGVNRLTDPQGTEIPISSIREGEVVGEHTVSFVTGEEIIEITHKALDRDVFARGALKAGEWLLTQPPGYYSTRDWLGLR